jgi:exopolysaccharide production protein ExoZ
VTNNRDVPAAALTAASTLPGQLADDTTLVRNIQALRGIAALLVLWAHLKFVFPTSSAASHESWVRTARGAMGVDLFFVISGYVICMTAAKRHHTPLDFILARVARVAPLYLLVTLCVIVPFLIRGQATWVPFSSIWNGLFYLPILDLQDYTEPPLEVGWTLSFEFWFYSVFALLLFFLPARRVALVLPLIFLAGVPLMTRFYGAAWYFPRFAFHPLVLEFAMGCLVYHTQKWFRRDLSCFLLLAGLATGLILARHSGDLGYHEPLLSNRLDLAWRRVYLWGIPWALIVAGLVGLERNGVRTLPRWLVWTGGISFSLYLTHTSVMGKVVRFEDRTGLHQPVVIVPLVIAACLVAAWLCWRFIERPLTSLAQSWARSISGRSISRSKNRGAGRPGLG